MYSGTVTLSILYAQEVCGTENKVGGMRRKGSAVQNNVEKYL
jgi:hypothetical protein